MGFNSGFKGLMCVVMYRVMTMIVGVLTSHTQYTWDRGICIFLFNTTTLQVFVTYLTDALYVHPLWFYKHQHDNRVRSRPFVACQRWWFQLWFWFVPSAPSGEMRNYYTPQIVKENFENFLIHRCKLHTPISSVLWTTSCSNPDNHL